MTCKIFIASLLSLTHKEKMYGVVVIYFQLVLSFMACLESCIGHMSQLSLTDELSISHLHSLPSAVIQTVKTAFKHCKVPYMAQYFCFVEG